MKILGENTHTQTRARTHAHLYSNSHVFRRQEVQQNIMEMQFAFLQIHFLSVSSSSNLYA